MKNCGILKIDCSVQMSKQYTERVTSPTLGNIVNDDMTCIIHELVSNVANHRDLPGVFCHQVKITFYAVSIQYVFEPLSSKHRIVT
jgi:hypothetical protein